MSDENLMWIVWLRRMYVHIFCRSSVGSLSRSGEGAFSSTLGMCE